MNRKLNKKIIIIISTVMSLFVASFIVLSMNKTIEEEQVVVNPNDDYVYNNGSSTLPDVNEEVEDESITNDSGDNSSSNTTPNTTPNTDSTVPVEPLPEVEEDRPSLDQDDVYGPSLEDDQVEDLTPLPDDNDVPLLPEIEEEEDKEEVKPDIDYELENDDYVYDGELALIYLTDVQSQIKNVQDNTKVVTYDNDHQGNLISLYDGQNEVIFNKGISAAGGDVCITFTDLKMYGYETFTASFGTHEIARITNSSTTSFSFRIVLDNELVYESDMFNAYSEIDYVEIDLLGYEVMQIFIDTNGNGTGDYAAIGDPMFIKDSPSPYIDVFDLEFNSPHQVTKSNLLQYADAWDLDLTNISDNVFYETDYVEGEIGEFKITYFVYGSNGVRASREVNLTVTGEDYSDPWTLEDYKTPYVNYLYHSRNTLTPQNRKLFDIVMPGILDFNPNGGDFYTVSDYTKWDETVYEVKFNLIEADIFLKVNEFNTSFHYTILDSDPRAYIFKQWECTGRYTSDSSTGLLKTYHMFISKSWFSTYDTQIEKIIANSEVFLDYAKDDMTDEQKLYYVTTPYKNWIQYNDGATISTALGNGYGKCGGNAMGVVHLAHRLGIASLYGQVYTSSGELHAASYQKLVDQDGWYMCDKLWAYQWTAPQATSFSLSKRGGYGWIDYASSSITSSKYSTYPSIWLNFEHDMLIIEENQEVDAYDNIISVGSIFDEVLTNDIVSITIKDQEEQLITCDLNMLPVGLYTIYYDLSYSTSSITINRTHEVNLAIYNKEDSFTTSLVSSSSNVHSYGNKGLYNATTKQEEYYYGVDINNGGHITLNNSEGYDALSLKFGPKTYSRTDSWASSFCKVRFHVYFDGVLQKSTATLTAFSNYVTLNIAIPEGVSEIKLYSQDVGGSAGHATIADIKLYSYDQNEVELEEAL